jgi:hypothetical protein
MKSRFGLVTLVCLFGLSLALGIASTATAMPLTPDDDDKLDQLTLEDGSVVLGDIIDETDETITMIVNVHGIKGKRTWNKSEVLQVLYDAIARDDDRKNADADLDARKTGRGKGVPEDASGRVVYVLPIRGEIGYDAHTKVIRLLWEEALDAGAETIVLEFDADQNPFLLDEYRDFFEELKRDAAKREIETVAWIERAEQIAVATAMIWPDIYFKNNGTMGQGRDLDQFLKDMFDDPDVRAKMISAWVGTCRGMAVEGGYNDLLCEAMIRPEMVLSLNYEGDHAIFYRDLGENEERDRIIDSDPTSSLELTAEEARAFAVSKGTAGRLEDLMFELGHREFYWYEGKAEDLTENWTTSWRDALQQVQIILAEIQQMGGWGLPPQKLIGMQIAKYNEIKSLIKRYPPLSQTPYNFSIEWVELQIEGLRKILREYNRNTRGTGSGRPGGRPGGGGGGGGGGG